MKNRPCARPNRLRSSLAVLACGLALGALPFIAPPAPAVPVSTEPAVAARATAAWLASQVNADGFVPTPADTPNVGATLDVALSLAATGVQQATFERIVAWLRDNVAAAIAPGGTTSPGTVGQVLLVLDVTGDDPTSFGGVDLVAELAATLGDYEPGLYGAGDPTFDGVFRQSLAILGLRAHGLPVPASASQWLLDQQCGGGATPASAVGGWQSYRADISVPCDAPDPMMFTGPDTNSTALAVQAAVALVTSPTYDAYAFLLSARESDGGFGFLPGAGSDPNSTSLVIQAIVAGSGDPGASPWTVAGVGPLSSLASWQLGCDADPAERGALTSPYSEGAPDQFASRQGAWGLAQRSFPLGSATWTADRDPCAPPDPTITTTVGSGDTPMTSAPVVEAVSTTPRFAG